MNCKVKISGFGGNTFSDGTLEFFDGGFKILYSLDGDDCEISFDGDTVSQARRGENDISLQFKQNAKTLCTFKNGDFCGTVDVFTKKLHVQATKEKVKINLLYILGDEECSLDFTATAD